MLLNSNAWKQLKNLYLSEEIARRIVPALQELVGDRATEVLPALQNIFLEEGQRSGPVQEGIQQVVTVRQATNHPIAVSYQPKLEFYNPFARSYDPTIATDILAH